jgi:hypothetical protein
MTYKNCDTAYADGVYNIPKVHPSYKPDLDGHGQGEPDGVACEKHVTGGTDLSNYQPSPTPSKTVTASPCNGSSCTTTTPTATTSPPTLPVTGPDNPAGILASASVVLLLLGITLVLAVRTRYKARHR